MFTWFKKLREKKFVRDTAYMYAGSLANGISLFLVSVVLGRTLTKDWFAIFSLSVLILSTVAEMSDLGLNGGLLRFAPFYIAQKQIEKLKQLVKTIWYWRVSLTSIITIIGMLAVYPLTRYVLGQPNITGQVAFSFLGVGGIIFLGFVSTYLQASQRFFYNAILQTLKGVLRLVLIVVLVLVGIHNVYFYIAVYIIVPWVLFLVSFHVLPKHFTKVVIDLETKSAINQQLAKFSMWLTIWSLFSILASRIDQALISRYLGLEQVAIYTVAYQLIQLYPYVSQSISAVMSPRISSLSTKAEVIPFLKRSLKWILVVMAILAIFVYPSQYIITLFFGSKYSASLPVYLVLAYSLVANLLAIPFSLIINAYNRTSLMALSGVVQMVVNVAGCVLLIPRYGIMGAAYTFALGIAITIVYTIVCSMYLLAKKEIIVR